MTLFFVDGFDHDDMGDVWTVTSASRDTATKRTGTASGQVQGSTTDLVHYFDLNLSQTDDGITVGFGFFATGAVDQQVLSLADRDSGVVHVSVRSHGTSRGWSILRGGNGGTTIAGSIPNVAFIGTWHYMELQVKVHNTAGFAVLRQDGVPILSYTGDTQNGGSALINRIGFASTFANPSPYKIDDVYMLNEQGSVNNDFLSDTRLYPLYPNGNGNYSQLLGSDGNSTDNYLLVDEPGAPVTTDYVGSATAGLKDTYLFEDLPVTLGTVRAVDVRMHAAKSETGTKQIRAVTRRLSTDAFGVDRVLSTAYVTLHELYELDPLAGPGTWTIDNVNGTEWGAEVRA